MKQQASKTSFKCKTPAYEDKVKACHEWIRACSAANIPLNKSENPTMCEFLLSHVVNGYTIPNGTQLRDHLLDAYELEKEELKQKILNLLTYLQTFKIFFLKILLCNIAQLTHNLGFVAHNLLQKNA